MVEPARSRIHPPPEQAQTSHRRGNSVVSLSATGRRFSVAAAERSGVQPTQAPRQEPPRAIKKRRFTKLKREKIFCRETGRARDSATLRPAREPPQGARKRGKSARYCARVRAKVGQRTPSPVRPASRSLRLVTAIRRFIGTGAIPAQSQRRAVSNAALLGAIQKLLRLLNFRH